MLTKTTGAVRPQINFAHNTQLKLRSPGALALGLFFAAVTTRTIFDDVWNGATVTTSHLQSLAAIVAALASGHMLIPVLKQAKLAVFLGMALIFVASTGYVVVAAGARNAEVSQTKVDNAADLDSRRDDAKAKVAQAESELSNTKTAYAKAADAAAKECASGKGTRCDGKTATRDNASRDVERAEAYLILVRAKLDVLRPATDPKAGYAHAALVIAALPLITATPEDIQVRLELLMPFAVVFVSEVGTLVFLSLAFGYMPASASGVTANTTRTPKSETVPCTEPSPEIPTPAPQRSVRKVGTRQSGKSASRRSNSGKLGRPTDPEIASYIESFRTKSFRTPTGSEILREFPDCPKSTAFDMAARARQSGMRLVS